MTPEIPRARGFWTKYRAACLYVKPTALGVDNFTVPAYGEGDYKESSCARSSRPHSCSTPANRP